MAEIGTPLSSSATKVLFCGAGELGKEVIIEMMRLGVEVVAVDRYANAPGMQVAHRSYVINMLDGAELRRVIEQEKPDFIVPEVEAIATDTLVELEKEGFHVIPTAKATKLTMNREGIRRLAAEELGLTEFNPAFLETNIWETERDREFVFIFASVGHPDLNPDNDEVTEGRWWTQAELTAAIGKNLLTPNFEAEYARIQGMLLALL